MSSGLATGYGAPAARKRLIVDGPQDELAKALQERDSEKVACLARAFVEGGLPDQFRGAVWALLLLGAEGVSAERRVEILSFVEDDNDILDNHSVVQADVARTRTHLPCFRDPQVRRVMERLLTLFCREREIKYKQGLNEVLAPFIYLHRSDSRPEYDIAMVYECFAAFIAKFLPLFNDDDFTDVQCCFLLFRHLLRYHDPTLCEFLDSHMVGPELYVSPWFFTAFASTTQIDHVLCLWDSYLSEDDRFFFCYLTLALMAHKRRSLLSTELSLLPETLARLGIQTFGHLRETWSAAVRLKDSTPQSFSSRLSAALGSGALGLEELEQEPGFLLMPLEVLRHSFGSIVSGRHKSTDGADQLWKLLILDLRAPCQFEAGHLPDAVNVDMEANPNWREELATITAVANKDENVMWHWSLLVSPKRPESAREAFAYLTTVLRIARVSVVRGGYNATHRLAQQLGLELVDHDDSRCEVCVSEQPATANERSNFSLTNMLKSFRKRRPTITTAAAAPPEPSQQPKVEQAGMQPSQPQNIASPPLPTCPIQIGTVQREVVSRLRRQPHFLSCPGPPGVGATIRLIEAKHFVIFAESFREAEWSGAQRCGILTTCKVESLQLSAAVLAKLRQEAYTDGTVFAEEPGGAGDSAQLAFFVPESRPSQLLVSAKEIAVLSTPFRRRTSDDSPERHAGCRVLLYITYALFDIVKITSKKRSPCTLCFYFSEKPHPEICLRFADENAAKNCISKVRAIYRSAKKQLPGSSARRSSDNCERLYHR